jgi:hypothetical protein
MDLELFLDTPPWDWPPDSRKIFLKVLTDNKAKESDRLIAAELAGDLTVIDDALAKALLRVAEASNQSEALRGKAAIALGPVIEIADTSEFDELEEVPISEHTFKNIKKTLKKICLDETVPKQVRRLALEASVRASEPWHRDAISNAYASGDSEWTLTAVFAMSYVHGFDTEILESLSNPDLDIHCCAIDAAGVWEISAAWPHIKAVVRNPQTPKRLLLACIEAIAGLHPPEEEEILMELADSDDEDINEAVEESLAMVRGMEDDDWEDDDVPEWIN